MDDVILKISLSIINFLGFIILGVISYNWKQQDTKITKVESQQTEIKDNYLTRFSEVNKNISATELRIVSAIKDLEIKFSSQCQVQHSTLKRDIENEFKRNKEG